MNLTRLSDRSGGGTRVDSSPNWLVPGERLWARWRNGEGHASGNLVAAGNLNVAGHEGRVGSFGLESVCRGDLQGVLAVVLMSARPHRILRG